MQTVLPGAASPAVPVVPVKGGSSATNFKNNFLSPARTFYFNCGARKAGENEIAPAAFALRRQIKMKQFDFLVLGSGIAGLSFALKVAPHGRVAIITKKNKAESNTNYAQGGIASVTSKEDSFELHVRDTLAAGAGLCKEDVVRTIVQEGPPRIQELIELGMKFTEREAGSANGAHELDLGREGGHSKRRILHAKDVTGREIERALLAAVAAQPNIQIFENHFAINLITSQRLGYVDNNRCLGVYVLDKSARRSRPLLHL